jgi:HlyD family secretion protein
MKTTIVLLLVIAVLAAGGWYLYVEHTKAPPAVFTTTKVVRNNLDLIIRASGPLEPEETIDVGAQVNGIITSFGKDLDHPDQPINYNSRVEPNTVLANIDDAVYQTQVAAAKASLAHGVADVATAKAKIDQANNDLDRATKELPTRAISKSDYDAAVANQKVAVASLDLANAEVDQAQAALKQAEINLGYTVIHAPAKGTIIDRRVNIGQTVISNQNAPSLFLIALDLAKMQVWASVNEADVQQIYKGQAVEFTVDAVPDHIFSGTVLEVHNNASMTQNVVNYTVLITVDNSDGKLRPYLTANVQFDAGRHPNVLQVPNGALRWRPQASQVRPEDREAFIQKQKARAAAKLPNANANGAAKVDLKKESAQRTQGTLWVQDGEFVRPVKVKIGVSDGAMTEIVSGDIKEGDEVVTGEQHAAASDSAKNPFLPNLGGGGGRPR